MVALGLALLAGAAVLFFGVTTEPFGMDPQALGVFWALVGAVLVAGGLVRARRGRAAPALPAGTTTACEYFAKGAGISGGVSFSRPLMAGPLMACPPGSAAPWSA